MMKGIAAIVALAVLMLLGTTASAAVTGVDAIETLAARYPWASSLARDYRKAELELNLKLENFFIEQGFGTPQSWSAGAQGYLSYVETQAREGTTPGSAG